MTEETGFADEGWPAPDAPSPDRLAAMAGPGEGARQELLALAADFEARATETECGYDEVLDVETDVWRKAASLARQLAEAIPPPPDIATRAFFAGAWGEGLD